MTAHDDVEKWVHSAGHSGLTAEACYDLCPDLSRAKVQDVLGRLRTQGKIWRRTNMTDGERCGFCYIHREFVVVGNWQRW